MRRRIMSSGGLKHVYGPVLSRRLGRSMGIDLVPFKVCTYDCVYCQLGKTTNKTIFRQKYGPIQEILKELQEQLAVYEAPNYVSIAGSGEPTLNSAIGEVIHEIKSLTDIPVAVFTNGALLWMPEVRDALMEADIVLPSLDAGDDHLFQYVNRPHCDISFVQMVDGIVDFTKSFSGEVWLEVLLLAGVTGVNSEVSKIAKIVERIGPARTQLNTVSRPPSEGFAFPLSVEQLCALKGFFPGKVDIIEEKEGNVPMNPTFSGAREADILVLLSRRPCTSSEVASGLGIHTTEVLKYMERMTAAGDIRRVFVGGRYFYAIASAKREGVKS